LYLLALILVIASACFSFLLNQLMYMYSRNLGAQYKGQNVVRWASTTKPTVGGFSFYVTFLLAGIVFLLTQDHDAVQEREFLVALAVVTLGFLVGLHDDAYETKPLVKFFGQVGCALILIAFGLGINIFGFWPVDHFLTLFWVVGIMNSINLLDNMDGVTGTVALTIVGSTILRITLLDNGPSMNPFLFTLIASCGAFIGFLMLNLKPSKIYMGDTGSQFLGAMLAVIGIKFFWNFEVDGRSVSWATKAIVPVMIFLVPIMDTTFVTVARLMRGQSPFVGGRDHLTHHMTYLGVADKFVPFVLGLISLGSGLLAVFGLRYLLTWSIWQTALFVGFILVVFVIFFRLYKKGERIGVAKQRFARTFERAYKERQDREYLPEEAQPHS
jgi:UDP-GlcNAc:undecaprenyl-phosphate/decaprenyl-phosphate GlcNAc-1-phosphate transferase